MSMNRRDFIKTHAVAAAAASAGLAAPVASQTTTASTVRWDKAACRFCGVGCSVLVGVQDGRVVATQGDPDSPVNRGLNCIKGYFLSKIMYGGDRLTQPMLRKRDGKFDKDGQFTAVSWDEAFDIMAEKWKAALNEHGPRSVGMFGSGQWTVWEGYAASKLHKAGFRTNNIDPNARHCMASAVAGFMRTFGMDEPMGCYDDIENADAFVLWGSNMAEMHPILWSRVTDRRLTHAGCEVHVLSTFEHRSYELADNAMIFQPHADLAIFNFIANHIITSGKVNTDFVDKHVKFRKGVTDIGFGLRPEHPLEQQAGNNGYQGDDGNNKGSPGKSEEMSFEDFADYVSEYTVERVSEISGVPAANLLRLAELYADPAKRVTSFWTMGMNQHTRGTWANNMVYNIHLLVGKISEPGNSPFSLTGQPSACGTAREVGTFAHRLPADMVVMNDKHRAFAEDIWQLPEGTIPEWVGFHAVAQSRALKDGLLRCYWTSTTNNMQAGPNINDEVYPGWRNPSTFVVVSDAYPTVSALAADLILPSAMWTEKEGAYGNAERRSQFWRQQVKAPGESRSDLWQYVEFSKRFRVEEVWPEELIAKKPEYRGKTLYDVLFANGEVDKYPLEEVGSVNAHAWEGYTNDESAELGYYLQKGLFEEYARFTRGKHHDLAPFDDYHRARGLRWPVVDGKETLWRYREGYDPYVKAGEGVNFYGHADGRATIFALPWQEPHDKPDSEFDLWMCSGRVLEHWHTGSMTRRVVELHRAVPEAQVFMHPDDARSRGLQRGMAVRVASVRGEIVAQLETRGRNKVPKGLIFVPFFDEGRLVNKLIQDATCPISKETDFKKCPVKVTRA